jgi:hemerythrin
MIANNSDLIVWSNSLLCGIKIIDDQHKGLVALINNLFKHVTGDPEQEHIYFSNVVQELVKYVKIHFATEEKIMRAVKFAGYAQHKREHDFFIFTVMEKVSDYNLKKNINLFTITKFLKEWVLSHIAIIDKQYFEHLRMMATRKADGTLSITRADVAA